MSKLVIEKYPGNKLLHAVFVAYGNACDGMKMPEKALDVYDQGLEMFPNYFLLLYNKGITFISLKKYDEAIACFENAIEDNPKHASSHNAIARIQNMHNKRIIAMMAYARFLVVEPESK